MFKCIYLVLALLLFLTPNQAQIIGCTDPLATNHNASANSNDGSCVYAPVSVSPIASFPLDSSIRETSGLIYLDGHLITHNDNDDIHLYSLDTSDGQILGKDSLNACINKEWEEISQDSLYLYLGDFGNNASGNRIDLRILRIEKSSFMSASSIVDTIYFSYADQTDFSAHAANTTDYDCEAFFVSKDSIYLLTKQWQSKKTCVYSLPKLPGNYSAQPLDTLNVNGLVTGAAYREEERLLVLSGYTNLLQPFSYLCYDFQEHDFFGANKRRIDIALPFHQIEGVATNDALKYYMTNESFVQGSLINSPQAFHIFDFTSCLNDYLNATINGLSTLSASSEISLYPNPTADYCSIKRNGLSLSNISFRVLNTLGEEVFKGDVGGSEALIDLRSLQNGIYIIELKSPYKNRFSIVKQSE